MASRNILLLKFVTGQARALMWMNKTSEPPPAWGAPDRAIGSTADFKRMRPRVAALVRVRAGHSSDAGKYANAPLHSCFSATVLRPQELRPILPVD